MLPHALSRRAFEVRTFLGEAVAVPAVLAAARAKPVPVIAMMVLQVQTLATATAAVPSPMPKPSTHKRQWSVVQVLDSKLRDTTQGGGTGPLQRASLAAAP